MRNISLPEAKYKKAERAIKTLEAIRPEVEKLHQGIWKIKNKLTKKGFNPKVGKKLTNIKQ